MRRSFLLLASVLAAFTALPFAADAQGRRNPEGDQTRRQEGDRARRAREQQENTPGRLPGRRNIGPCPYVKVLYDAARYVELEGGRQAAEAVGWTGEIQGLEADCTYLQPGDPIRVDVDVTFQLGRGPQAQGNARSYRWWVAVTDRNRSVLAKEYFDLPANFENGEDRITVVERLTDITIPRASETTSGSNFEILVGFDVTPQMAEFNREGRRFLIDPAAAARAQAAAR